MQLKSNELAVFKHAVIFGFGNGKKNNKSSNLPTGNRGEIVSFSKDSSKRLRLALATQYIPSAALLGVTLTVPWRKQFDGYLDYYRECFNRFATSFRRDLPNSGAIFRHELQKRRMPHCHMIVYASESDFFSIDALTSYLFGLWSRSCPVRDGRHRDFLVYGVQVKSIDDLPGLWKYLADHASKKKQAQLGYQGKQWGYIRRKNFVSRDCDLYKLRPEVVRLVVRQLSRIYRYCKKSDCVFGYKHCNRRTKCKVGFYTERVVSRVVDYFSSELSAALPLSSEKMLDT